MRRRRLFNGSADNQFRLRFEPLEPRLLLAVDLLSPVTMHEDGAAAVVDLAAAFADAGLGSSLDYSVAFVNSVETIVDRTSQDFYTHIHDNLLFTHSGDDRGIGGAEHDLAQDNIAAFFEDLGLSTSLDPFSYNGQTYYNVVGVKLGTVTPQNVYVIGAHYDSVSNAGADDNGSGTAAVMEVARALAPFEFESTIRFIAFDREEQGLVGSGAYVAEYSSDNIVAMVNLDMIGYNPAGVNYNKVSILDGDNHDEQLKQDLIDAFELSGFGGEVTAVDGGSTNRSDHASFDAAGFDSALIIENQWGSNPYYHRSTDAVETAGYIDYAFATDIASAVTGYVSSAAGMAASTNLLTTTITDSELIVDSLDDQNGVVGIVIRAEDELGAIAEREFTVTVNPATDAPSVATPIDDVVLSQAGSGTRIDLTGVFFDADTILNGDVLTISVTGNTNPGLVSTVFDEDAIIVSQGSSSSGTSQITVRATDELGLYAEEVFVVTALPGATIIDNGDAGFAAGGFVSYPNEGYQNDIHYSGANWNRTATWTFDVPPGTYQVSGTWSAASNRATDAPFTIKDGSNVLATVKINQEVAPNDFTDGGANWENLGNSYTITGNTLVVELTDMGANQYVIADGIRIERIGELVPAPEIQLWDGAIEIADNSGSVAFGTTPQGTAVSKTFTVHNTGTQDLTLVEPISVPAGFAVAASFSTTTVSPGATATFVVQLAASAEGTFSGPVSFATNDADENPFNFAVSGSVPILVPEIEVWNGAVEIADNSVEFGTTPQSTPVSKTFTVHNAGTQNLTLVEPISVPNGFAVASSFSTTTVSPGGTATFVVQLAASAEGTFSGPVSFATNDADENPFNFTANGSVALASSSPEVQIIDNGDAGFAAGGFVSYPNQGYQNDVHYSGANWGRTATWTFAVSPGTYQVSATWPPLSNRATDAPYTIKDGSNALATVKINQKVAPNDFTDGGASWENLGNSYTITGNTLTVELTDLGANQYVIADAIRIEGAGVPALVPEIQVQDGAVDIADNSGSVAFGTTPQGTPVSKTFTVYNAGTQDLTLVEPISVPAGFVVASSFSTTTVSPGATATFVVQLAASAEGTFSGSVSFATNDADENPFNFTVSGSVPILAPEIEIWNGAVEIADNSGSVAFGTTTQGTPVSKAFTVHNTGTQNLTLVEPISVPAGFVVASSFSTTTVSPGATATFVVQLAASVEGTFSGSVSFATNDADENPFNFTVSGSVPILSPEIEVWNGAVEIADNSGSVAFGTTTQGTPVSKTFTVHNAGTQNLTLVEPISVPAGFAVTSSFSTTTVSPGSTATFVVQLAAGAEGTFSGPVSFATNDADENPFNFTASGSVTTVLPPSEVQIIDNGDAGFAAGGFVSYPNQGYQNDVHYSGANWGRTATWTFAVSPGTYQVSATWSPLSNRATDAPYTIKDGSNALATVKINQKVAPNDFTDEGVGWENLGGPYTITGNTLTVELTDLGANQYVIADAIRIEGAGVPVLVPEIQVQDGAVDIADNSGSVAFGTTPQGTPVSKTFTVYNTGTQDLTLVEPISVPAGFAVTSSFSTTTVSPGSTATFVVQFAASAEGTFSGSVSFATNDADENPFNFTVSGNALVLAPEIQVCLGALEIVDNSGSVAFGTTPQGASVSKILTVHNTGTQDLTLVEPISVPAGFVLVSSFSTTTVSPGATATFVVQFEASAEGTFSGPVSFATNDADENPFNFTVSGSVSILVPEIQVWNGAVDIADNSGSVAFGTTPQGTPVSKTFTVHNTGTKNLTLVGPISVPAGFAVTSSFSTTTVSPGNTATFVVQLAASVEGTFSGQLSFASDDADESLFNFTVSGDVVVTSQIVQIIDNGDAGFVAGGFTAYPNQGYQNDVHYSGANWGRTATWTFAVSPGTYQVSATWSPLSNRATDAPFTVKDGSNALATVDVNQKLAPDDFTDEGASWEYIGGSYTISGNTLVVELTDIGANQYVIADAVRIASAGVVVTSDPPIVSASSGAASYTENASSAVIDAGLTVTDSDSTNLVGATVEITAGLVSSEDSLVFSNQLGITGSYNAATGVLTLNGAAAVANYQAALRSVRYLNSSENPSSAQRTVTFRVSDSDGSGSATRAVTVLPVNDAPQLATNSSTLNYVSADPAMLVDSGLTAADVDSAQLVSAIAYVSAGFVSGEDVLSYTSQYGIAGSYNATAGVLSLSGTASVAEYQTVLCSVTYVNSSGTPSVGQRTVTFTVSDGAASDSASRIIEVTDEATVVYHVTLVANYLDNPGEGFYDPVLGQQRQDAMSYAMGLWSDLLVTSNPSETITIDTQFNPMGGSSGGAPLGTGGCQSMWPNVNGGVPNTWYVGALANHLAGTDLDPSASEISTIFNSDVDNSSVLGATDWYYGVDGNTGIDVDFVSVALHEIAHGLTFMGLVGQDGSLPYSQPSIYDRFLEIADGTDLTSMSDAGRAAAVVSNQLYWNGAEGVAGNAGSRPKMYAPSSYSSGSSVSHLDLTEHGDEIMAPICSGVDHSPSAMELGMLADMGWTIAGVGGAGASYVSDVAASASSSTGTSDPTEPLLLDELIVANQRFDEISLPIGLGVDIPADPRVFSSQAAFSPHLGVDAFSGYLHADDRGELPRWITKEMQRPLDLTDRSRPGHLAHDLAFSDQAERSELDPWDLQLIQIADDLVQSRLDARDE